MKKSWFAAALAVLFLFSLSGCAGSSSAAEEDGKLHILATTYPVYLFTTALTGGMEEVEVTRLINGEVSCLHDYTLSVNDMKAIEKADVIVMNGAGLEDFMSDALDRSDAAVINCSEGIALLPAQGHEGHGHEEEESGHYDPHIWMDPDRAVQMLENIRAGLAAVVPNLAEALQTNTDAALELLDPGRQGLAGPSLCALATNHSSLRALCTDLSFITFHDGFQYFAQAFDLDLLRSIEEEEGSEASAQEIKEIVSLIGEHRIPAIFTEVNGSDATARAISRETGVAVRQLDMIMSGDGVGIQPYIDAICADLQTIAEALG